MIVVISVTQQRK